MTDVQWWIAIGAWLAIGVIAFGIFESRGKVDGPVHTLSRAVWDLFRAFPLAIIVGAFELGLLIGGLMVHFFWHWNPPGSESLGSIFLSSPV